eukprot:16335374-Heterocapsa_arctica.AAC.1
MLDSSEARGSSGCSGGMASFFHVSQWFFQQASLAACAADLCHVPASRCSHPRLVRMCREEP